MNKFLVLAMLLAMTGCTTVNYNGTKAIIKEVDYPEIGKEITAYVGDYLVQKGSITEEDVLIVHEKMGGISYDILPNEYPQIGFDEIQDFYAPTGVVKAILADHFKALSLKREPDSELCVVTIFGASSCYKGKYERKKKLSERGNSFQQTLIYSGRIGNKINISYREFSNSSARPAFNNDVEYDLSSSTTIGYKGALIEVIHADNSSIIYKLIRNFP